jgi:hypothetical protein
LQAGGFCAPELHVEVASCACATVAAHSVKPKASSPVLVRCNLFIATPKLMTPYSAEAHRRTSGMARRAASVAAPIRYHLIL